MANNIAYYVSGNQNSAKELKLVTNINQKEEVFRRMSERHIHIHKKYFHVRL